jgi:MFS family permease
MTLPFLRDQFTWLAYWMLAYYAYMQAAQSQAMLFLSDELRLNYTVRSLHLSAFALGMVLAGLTADRIARRWGRVHTFWSGGLGMAMAAVLFTYGIRPEITVACSFVMGFIGSFLLIMIQATLSDKYGEQRAIALTEANVVASVATGLAPLLVGGFQGLNIGWRTALYVGAVSWGLMAFGYRRASFPEVASSQQVANAPAARVPLPLSFWAYALVVFINVAIEWCLIFWGAEFLEQVIGFSGEVATTLMTAFFAAMVIGRLIGSALTRRIPSSRLLLVAQAIVLIGFPVFWLARFAPLNILGLFITGLGVANLFPLTLSTASSAAPLQANTASARISMASGSAILIVPQLLGSAADNIGIASAYGMVVVLVLIALTVTLAANRRAALERSTVELKEGAAAIQ